MTRKEAIKNFNPNQVGVKNGNFIGLPFDAENAQIVLLPVNWDATVSYGAGTATGPLNILEASSQLDLEIQLWKKPGQKGFT
jgi:agmatinase